MTLKWLDQRLETFIPVIASLTTADEEQIRELVAAEINAWKERPTMKNERSLRNPMYFARRALEEIPLTETNSWHNPRYNRREHIALKYMDFTPQQWTEYNASTSTQLENRLQHSQFIDDPDAIIQTADVLLETEDWASLVAGLVVNTGRRHTELLKTASFSQKTAYSLIFSGQLKSAGQVSFEIPTFSPSSKVTAALDKLRSLIDTTQLSHTQINQRYSQPVIEAIAHHFTHLVPQREGKDNLYTHLFRAVYARMAVWYYCPPHVADIFYMATIQGHYRFLNSDDQEYRLNFASTAHYYDYQISDRLIVSHGGVRQGIWLERPGVELLASLQSDSSEAPEKLAETASETSQETASEPEISSQLELFDEPEISPAAPELSPLAQTAIPLLESEHYTIVLTALIALTGRSPGELIKSGKFSLHPEDSFSLLFSHQIAKGREAVAESAPPATATLAPATDILDAIAALRNHNRVQKLRFLSPNEILSLCLPHIVRVSKKYFHLSHLEELITAYAEATGTEKASLPALTEGAAHKASTSCSIWTEDKPRLEAIGEYFQTLNQADTTSGILQLAETALASAKFLGTAPEQLTATIESMARKNQELERQLKELAPQLSASKLVSQDEAHATTTATTTFPDTNGMETKEQIQTLASTVSSLVKRLSALEQIISPSAPSATIPHLQETSIPVASEKPENHKASSIKPQHSRRNSAEAKIERAFLAVVAHNEQCSSNDQRWAITESALARLTGCNRPAIRRYFSAHEEAISQHNHRYQFSSRHNAKLSRHNRQIETEIRF